MKREFFVWTDRMRAPAIADIARALTAVGFQCYAQDQSGGAHDPFHWTHAHLDADTDGTTRSCVVRVDIPSRDQIERLAEDYEDLPYQVTNASRKYTVAGEADEHGQAALFQLHVVAALARLTNGVVEDREEAGLMMLDEFEDFIASA